MAKNRTTEQKRRHRNRLQRERRAAKKAEAEAAAEENAHLDAIREVPEGVKPEGVRLADIIDDPKAVGEALAKDVPKETITILPKEEDDKDAELTPEYHRAVEVTMELLDQFIIYEKDSPEEARLQIFPAFMHIKIEHVAAEIFARYRQEPEKESGSMGTIEDLKLIQWGIDDALDILKKRTDGAFPSPGQGGLSDLQFEALVELAHIEAAYFYRYTEEDLTRGYIQLNSIHTIGATSPVGSRFRMWLPVQKFAKKFMHVLAREGVADMVLELMQDEVVIQNQYDRYLLRWREAELI